MCCHALDLAIHRRVQLVVLTEKGRHAFDPPCGCKPPWINKLSEGPTLEDVAATARVVASVRQKLEGKAGAEEERLIGLIAVIAPDGDRWGRIPRRASAALEACLRRCRVAPRIRGIGPAGTGRRKRQPRH